MSFVSMLATDNFITFMSDGRVKDNDDNTIVMENYKKLHRVDNNTVIAITGSKQVSETVLNNLSIFNRLSFGHFGASILEKLQQIPNLSKSFFIIGGINSDGHFAYTQFDTTSRIVDVVNIPFGGIDGKVLFNKYDPSAILKQKIEHLISEGYNLNTDIAYNLQSEINNAVAAVDDSVNTTLFFETITR